MQVVHSSIGKLHHHDIAKQLDRHHALAAFFTGYPKWKLKHACLPTDRVRTFPWVVTPYMALGRWRHRPQWLERELVWQVCETFDRHVAAHLPEADAYIGLSCGGLWTGREAIRRGMRYLCDRGSSHILTQDRLLREEFSRWGETYPGIDPRVIEKEQAEYATADAILVPSEFVARSFVDQGIPARKLIKILYGVDLSRFQPAGAPGDQDFTVLFVGQLAFRKGLPDLLDAFGRLEHRSKRLILVGSMQPEMSRFLGQHPPAAKLEIRGHIPQPRLKAIMSRAHVIVLPSLEEGLALVMAQAMACGCPVIASEHTGASDLFSDGEEGFVVPIRSPAVIADRLQRLADEPGLRERMSQACLRKIDTLGGWDAYGDQLVASLDTLINTRATEEPCA